MMRSINSVARKTSGKNKELIFGCLEQEEASGALSMFNCCDCRKDDSYYGAVGSAPCCATILRFMVGRKERARLQANGGNLVSPGRKSKCGCGALPHLADCRLSSVSD
eukprot:2177045-Rhodomonas_salina.1